MLEQATKRSMDRGVMPIHVQHTIRALRKGVSNRPRTDECTLAFQFKPVK
jgi:hypothetical protein